MATLHWAGGTDTDLNKPANYVDDGANGTNAITAFTGSDPANDDIILQSLALSNVARNPTVNANVEFNSLKQDSGSTLTGNASYSITIGGEKSAYAVDLDGALGSNVNIIIETAEGTALDLLPSSGSITNLTINHASCTAVLYTACTLSGNFTITAGEFQTGSNHALTVTGDVSITGTLIGNASAISMGSLTIAAAGTYSATSGTTTITNETSDYAFKNDGTFTHNKGEVFFDGNTDDIANTRIQSDDFYDFRMDCQTANHEVAWDDKSGSGLTIYGNLIITQGSFEGYTEGDALTIHGLTDITANGKFENDGDHTGTVTHHGLVTNAGIYKTSSGTNNFNGGIRNLNDWGRSDTITINGTGGILEGNLNAAPINVNLDPAMRLDGTGDYINVGSASELDFGTNDFSISMWVKFGSEVATSEQHIISRGQAGNTNGFTLRCASNETLYFRVSDGSNSSTYDLTPNLNSWTHLAITLDRSANAVLYVNGVAKITQDISADSSNAISHNNWLIGGENSASPANLFIGSIADVKMFADLLSATEVTQLASKINCDSATFGIDNRKVWWKLNDGDASIVDHDDSGTAHDVTLTNGHWDYDAFSVNVQDGLASAGGTTTNGAVTVTQGKLEGLSLTSGSFAGDNDYINAGDISAMDGATKFTLSAWVKRAGAGDAITIAKGSSANDRFGINVWTDGVVYLNVSVDGTHWGQFASNDTNWHHIVMVFDGAGSGNAGRLQGYLDGVQQTLSFTGTIPAATDSNSANFQIGNSEANSNTYSEGNIRDVRFCDYPLSSDQVASLYSGSYNVTPTYWWKIDDGSGNAAQSGINPASLGAATVEGGMAWTNGTLDLDSNLSIGASNTSYERGIKAYFSAPRGELQCHGNFKNLGSYIHNNGMFKSTLSANIQDESNVRPIRFYDYRSVVNTTWRNNRVFTYAQLDGAIDATQTSIDIDGTENLQVGDYLRIVTTAGGYEWVRIEAVTDSNTLQVERGKLGYPGAACSNNADVALVPVTTFEGTYTNPASTTDNIRGATTSASNQEFPCILEFGTETSVGIFENLGTFEFDETTSGTNEGSNVGFGGVSPIYPAEYKSNSTDIEWGSNADFDGVPIWIMLWNLDYQVACSIGGSNNIAVKLVGDCEFDALTVESGDTLDVNGQRLECSGTLTVSGTIDYGGGLVIAGRFDLGGTQTNEEDTNFIANGAGSPVHAFNPSTFVGNTNTNILFNSTSDVGTTHSSFVGNLIIGNGKLDSKGGNIYCTDLTIATGATWDPENDEIDINGNLTMSGGLIGKSALTLDGTGDYMRAGTYGSANNFTGWSNNNLTVEAWYKSSSSAQAGIIASYWGSGSKHFILYREANGSLRAAVNVDGGSTYIQTNTAEAGVSRVFQDADDGKWHNYAMTYDGANLKLYIDGALYANRAVAVTLVNSANGIFTIGAYHTGSNDTHSASAGLIGDVARCSVWNHTLTESEIRTMMFYDYATMDADSDFNTPQGDLKGWYQFDEGTSTSIDNLTTVTNVDGLLVNGVWAAVPTFDSESEGTGVFSNHKFSKGSGTQYIYCVNGTRLDNIEVTSGSTLKIETINDSGGELRIYGDTAAIAGTLTAGDTASNAKAVCYGSTTWTLGSSANSLSGLYSLEMAQTSFSVTGGVYNNDPTITHTANANIKVGQSVTGSGIPNYSFVKSITDSTHFELGNSILGASGADVSTTGGSKTGQTLTLGHLAKLPASTLKRIRTEGAGNTLLTGALTLNGSDGTVSETNQITLASGFLDTGSNQTITATGKLVLDGGHINLNGSTVDVGSVHWTNASSILNGHTSTIDLNNGTSGGWIWYKPYGTFNYATSTVVCKENGKHIRGDFYNLKCETPSEANRIIWRPADGGATSTMLVHGDLTIVEGGFDSDAVTNNMTVTGDVSIESGGHLGRYRSDAGAPESGSRSFGSLTIASGGEYYATSGTTTITSETSGGKIVDIASGGTFTHNNGKLRCEGSNGTDFDFDNEELYDLEIDLEDSNGCVNFDGAGSSAVTVLNNLDIVMGKLRTNTSSWTVHGNVYIRETSKTNKNKFVSQGVTQTIKGTLTVEDGAIFDAANEGSGSSGTLNVGGIRVL